MLSDRRYPGESVSPNLMMTCRGETQCYIYSLVIYPLMMTRPECARRTSKIASTGYLTSCSAMTSRGSEQVTGRKNGHHPQSRAQSAVLRNAQQPA
jgi:hypothetical protein